MMGFLSYAIGGFFAFIGLLIVLTLIFGKRIDKKWEYEADFRNAKGREIGEFDIELSRIANEGQDHELKAKLFLRHDSLTPGRIVEVELDNAIVMRGPVETSGRILLQNEHLVAEINDPQSGQICVVRCEGHELFREPIHPD